MSSNQKVPLAKQEPGSSNVSTLEMTKRRRHRSGLRHRLRRSIRRLRWIKVLVVMVAVSAVAIVSILAILVESANRVQDSIDSVQRVVISLSSRNSTSFTSEDFSRLSASVNDLVNSLSEIRNRLNFAQPIASLNSDLKTTFTSIDAAHHIALAGQNILNGLQPTLFFLLSGNDSQMTITQISSAVRALELLSIGRGQFISAGEHLRIAQTMMENLDLAGTDSRGVLEIQQLLTYQNQLMQVNDILIDAPNILNYVLGISAQRSYLVLSQNNDEIRPSGGFLSTYGWITIRNGRIIDYNYSPSTITSPNPPSSDFASTISIPEWWIRYREPIYAAWDGSWYPDFPSTALMAMSYYNAGNNPHSPVDGAVSIDITGFEYLLQAIGTINVPNYSQAVTASNFRQVVYDIRAFGANELAHKRFLADLYQEIFSEWQNISADPEKNILLLSAMLNALQEKHIMLYFSDEQLNTALNLLGWSGAQSTATDHDYIMVVDANLGNKSNHSIIRNLTYDVDIQDNGAIYGRTTVAYDYSAQVAAGDPAVNPLYHGDRDYSNLLQVFVPRGTTFTQATNLPMEPIISTNALRTEFISTLLIPFDSSQRYQFSYLTPPLIEQLGSYQRYRLLMQKQPGTHANAVNVQIMLPADATFVSSTPAAATQYDLERPILEFRTDLLVDRWIEIVYQQ